MKFKLKTSGHFYTEEDAIPLRDLGFTFKQAIPLHESIFKEGLNRLGPSLIIHGTPIIYFNTLEELAAFATKWGEIIVTGCETIEIYDDYRE
jgi:hypothetical protein